MAKNADETSAEHRRKLEAMFSGGAKPNTSGEAAPRERVFANARRSGGRSPSEYRMRLERLRIARDVDELRDATDTFLQHHQLPDDPDVLTKVMQHPSEKVVREAMGQISALLMQGRMPITILLDERLKELQDRCSEPATRSYVQGIQAQIAALRK
ncbi:MAG: hypothetical protein ACAI38_02205 [Myxococcota bacterium]|nr:hypothetical protein [Myxococcota bacterium]